MCFSYPGLLVILGSIVATDLAIRLFVLWLTITLDYAGVEIDRPSIQEALLELQLLCRALDPAITLGAAFVLVLALRCSL